MPEQNNHITNYTAADIERYYKGGMSAQEMHLLEKAALDDPFLADALEGYAFTPTPASDAAWLKEQLKERANKNKVVVLPARSSSGLWKVAAMVVIMAGASWFIYQFSINRQTQDVAATTKENKVEETDATVSDTAADTSSVILQETEDHLETPSSSTSSPASVQRNEGKQMNSSLSEREEGVTASVSKELTSATGNDLTTKDIAAAAPSLEKVEGRIIRQDSLNEVVVTGYGTQRKVSTTAQSEQLLDKNADSMPQIVLSKNRRDTSVKRGQRIIIEEAEPENGYGFYDEYVADNLKTPEDFTIKTPAAEVKLSFEVNQLGEPINIKVVKSLCEQCDKEAIRLLKEGPKWVKKKGKKGKVSIRFN